jgi:Protein of unknown function (DUF3999)
VKRVSIAFAASLAVAAASSALAEAPSDFAMRQPLATPSGSAFYQLDLPDSVYDGAARPDLGDLRVFNANGEAVPYAFLPRPSPIATASTPRGFGVFPLTVDTTRPESADLSIHFRVDAERKVVDIRSRDGTPVSGSRVEGYLVDTGELDKPLVGLTLRLREAGDVNARVRVDASDDLASWRTIVTSAPLLSLTHDGRRLVRDKIEFGPSRARYLRLTWLTPQAPALEMVQGDVGSELLDPPRRMRKAAGVAEKDNPNAFVFDLGSVLPAERLTLELPELNTVVPVYFDVRTAPEEPWRSVGFTVAYRLRQEGGEAVNTALGVVVSSARYVRARLDPKAGGVGKTPPTLVVGWYAQPLVFAARGEAPFELAYGSRRVEPGALAIRTLVPDYVAGKPLPANVGVATLAAPPSEANRAAMREPLDATRWLLWGTLVAASVLLGYMGLRLTRQMKRDE